MSIKRILAVLSGSDADGGVAAAAYLIAARASASVEGLLVRGDFFDTMPYIEGGMSESAMAREFAAVREARSKAEERARASLEAAGAAAGASASFGAEDGRLIDIVGQRGRVYDLTVISPDGHYTGASAEDVVASALFTSGRPVLVTPRQAPTALGAHILIGWNRSTQAARAVACALPLLEDADKVTIVHVDTGAKAGPGPDELKINLSAHGIDTEVKLIEHHGGSVGHDLNEAAREVGADMLVLGAFSHSRFREMVFGGVTAHFIDEPELPVLMAY